MEDPIGVGGEEEGDDSGDGACRADDVVAEYGEESDAEGETLPMSQLSALNKLWWDQRRAVLDAELEENRLTRASLL